jgi:hypothetical protein
MTAIVDSRTALWRIVDSTQVLPLAGAHFRTCQRTAWRTVGEQSHDNRVRLLYQEPTKFVEPNLFRCVGGRTSQLAREICIDRNIGYRTGWVCIGVVKRFEVFRQLKR